MLISGYYLWPSLKYWVVRLTKCHLLINGTLMNVICKDISNRNKGFVTINKTCKTSTLYKTSNQKDDESTTLNWHNNVYRHYVSKSDGTSQGNILIWYQMYMEHNYLSPVCPTKVKTKQSLSRHTDKKIHRGPCIGTLNES